MAARIRLRRTGTTKKPSYRVVVRRRTARDGRFIEQIGFYDPLTEPPTIRIDTEKASAWIRKGASLEHRAAPPGPRGAAARGAAGAGKRGCARGRAPLSPGGARRAIPRRPGRGGPHRPAPGPAGRGARRAAHRHPGAARRAARVLARPAGRGRAARRGAVWFQGRVPVVKLAGKRHDGRPGARRPARHDPARGGAPPAAGPVLRVRPGRVRRGDAGGRQPRYDRGGSRGPEHDYWTVQRGDRAWPLPRWRRSSSGWT